MACYRCGTRQVDPARGHSPWQRGVRGDQQVLICPTCQGSHDWKADLDHCGQCGSVRLVRRLGEGECRDCGYVITPEDRAVPGARAAANAGSAGRRRAAADAGAGGGVGAAGEVAVPAEVAVGAGGVAALTGAGVGRDAEVPGLSSAGVPVLSGADAPGLSEEVARALDRVLGRGPVGRLGRPH
jgi:hypothetical protein